MCVCHTSCFDKFVYVCFSTVMWFAEYVCVSHTAGLCVCVWWLTKGVPFSTRNYSTNEHQQHVPSSNGTQPCVIVSFLEPHPGNWKYFSDTKVSEETRAPAGSDPRHTGGKRQLTLIRLREIRSPQKYSRRHSDTITLMCRVSQVKSGLVWD